MTASERIDIRTYPSGSWDPIRTHRQSSHSVGLCERCGGEIATNELHETRHWRGGLAEACQHITCPERRLDIGFVVSLNEIPAHLVPYVQARLGLELQALLSEPFDDLEDADLADDDLAIVRGLAGHASLMA